MPEQTNLILEDGALTRSFSSLRILHILDHSLPLQSGYTFRSHNIFRAQQKRGWNPVVVTSHKQEQNWKGPWRACEEIGGVRYYRTGGFLPGALPLQNELRLMSALVQRIREVIEIEQPDLLHAHSPILNGIPALRVGRQMGLPVVYEVRALWEDAAVDHGTYGTASWKYRIVRFGETQVCRWADQVAVLCQGLKTDLIRRGVPGEKLTPVFNGIDTSSFQACEPSAEYRQAWKLAGKEVIGFIGSFYRYEGLDLLVEAFARLAARRPDVVLLLVGGGEVEAELRSQVQQLCVEGRVVFAGRIPHEHTPCVYALMDLMVYPRRSIRLTELVTPLKPLEAMAMGKAVVASDIGGHRELLRHGQTGLCFPAGDVSALTQALETLLENPTLRQYLAHNGTSWVRQEHSWEKTTAAYVEIYTRALEHSAARSEGRTRKDGAA